ETEVPDNLKSPSPGSPAGTGPVPEVMTARQLADYLQINLQVLYRYIRQGLIPVAKLGKTVRFKKSVIDHWLEISSWESLKPGESSREEQG
ncbi:unnamed protein product, partial [marine sediment metagenome]